jgi:hypothetical protein
MQSLNVYQPCGGRTLQKGLCSLLSFDSSPNPFSLRQSKIDLKEGAFARRFTQVEKAPLLKMSFAH